MKKSIQDIAALIGGQVIGNPDVTVRDIRPVEEAGEGDLTFIADKRYAKLLKTTAATAILAKPGTEAAGKNLILCEDPYAAFGKLLAIFYPPDHGAAGISPDAYIEEGALVSDQATLLPRCVISRGARVDRGAVIYPGVYVGRNAVIGEDSVLYANVTVYHHCLIGKRVILHSGVVIGADGFGFASPGVANIKIPQVGIVQIDDDVEIGANTTVDRATMGKTWIGRNVKIDNLVQIAHNVVIGENSAIAAQAGISGSTRLGRSVMMGGQAGIVGHLTIGDHVMIAAASAIHRDVASGQIVGGAPHLPYQEWLKVEACRAKLPEMRAKLEQVSRQLETLKKQIQNPGEG
ncbi:MAG: UDP-3-O-(3-hydroxymyristoyl)glucosamine N-acyltransferase [Smithellaceae bacterium]